MYSAIEKKKFAKKKKKLALLLLIYVVVVYCVVGWIACGTDSVWTGAALRLPVVWPLLCIDGRIQA